MVKQRHGEQQFKEWRRGYSTAPPPVSSFSQHYPGNDRRYQKNLNDVRISARETIIRSIESGKLTFARKLPKSESLKDCMDRTIPFYTERIVPEAIEQGKYTRVGACPLLIPEHPHNYFQEKECLSLRAKMRSGAF